MTRKLMLALTITFAVGASAAQAQNLSGCSVPNRITLPTHAMISGMPKNRVVGWIYDQDRSAAVLSSGRCSCSNWHPTWDAAIRRFDAEFGRGGVSIEQLRAYGAEVNKNFITAMRMCSSQGIY